MVADSSTSTLPTRPSSDLEFWLVGWLARHLEIDSSAIDCGETLHRLGLDSVGATRLADELSQKLGRPLSSVLAWEHPTVAELVNHLTVGSGSTPRNPATHAPAEANEAIAIIGMAGRFPAASSPRELWSLLCEGRDAVGDIPDERWAVDKYFHPDPAHPETMNTRRGGFLDQIDQFDPLFFRISPREAEQMDPQQRLMLELSWEALEDSGIAPATLAGSSTGVFFGAMWRDYADLHRELRAPTTLHTGPGLALNIIANRVSYALDLQGPSLVVDTACSSALVATHLACQSLRAEDASLALVGGVSLMISPTTMVRIAKYGGLSSDGRCKSCDSQGDGFGRSEGGGVVVLKRLTQALFDGDQIYCVIRSSAVNNDGSSNGLTAPNPRAQVAVLEKAYRGARIRPEQVDYVEMHGAGTALGDPIEAEAISRVLCAQRSADRPLVIGAVKSNLAHMESASGASGLIKTALAIHHRRIPPNVHFRECNPKIALEKLKLRVPTEMTDWPRSETEGNARPALAGINAFGWGGTNSHLVLEGMPMARPSATRRPPNKTEDGGPLVFVCSPVGSQWCGMGRDLLAGEPAYRAAWKECAEIHGDLTGVSLLGEIARAEEGPRWTDASFVLPAIFTMDVAMAALWRSWGVLPNAVCGHSLGEITAAHLAGALTLHDALRVVYHYSRLMARLHNTGTAIVGLPASELDRRLAESANEVWVAGENSPRSTLLAGRAEALEGLLTSLQPAETFRARVRISATNHCPLSEPHMDELRESLADLRPGKAEIPLFSALTGTSVEGPELTGEHWARHYAGPVHFAAVIDQLLTDGHGRFVQLGPHPVLDHPLRECFESRNLEATTIACMHRDQGAAEPLMEALEKLADRREDPPPATHLVLLSAKDPEALGDLAGALASQLRETPSEKAIELADLASTTALRRSHHEHRMALVVDSVEQTATCLEQWLADEAVPAASVSRAAARRAPRTAFVFSGQGPQWWWAKGAELLTREPVFAAMIARCDEELRGVEGVPAVAEAIVGGVDSTLLQRPAMAQPILLSVQLGLEALWRSWGIVPSVVFGHSFGEVAAAHAAGVLSFADAIRVAVHRGRVMEAVLGSGTMASVEVPAEKAEEICRPFGQRLVVASLNAPNLVALSGEIDAVREVVEKLTEEGVSCWQLRVKLPFHSPLMEEAGQQLETALAGIEPREGHCPIISAVTGELAEGSAFGASYWRRNVRQPVLFHNAVEAAAEMNCEAFVEITTQPLLANAMTQCLEARGESPTVVSAIRPGREHASLLEALGGLYVRGSDVDWSRLNSEARPVPLPTYPFQRQSYWLEPSATETQDVPEAQNSSVPANAAGSPVEAVMEFQLQAFNRLVSEQLAAIQGGES